MPLGDASVCS